MGTSLVGYELNHTCVCCSLSCLESLYWQDVVWLTVSWDPNEISFGAKY